METKHARLALLLALSAAPADATATHTLASPNGAVAVELRLDAGRPRWSASHHGRPVVAAGLLGVDTGPGGFSGEFEVAGTSSAAGDTTWRPPWGELAEVRDRFRELTVVLRELGGDQRLLHVVLRACDEGVAVRYHFPPQPKLPRVTIRKRLTEFRFLANHPVYQCRNYQYGNVRIGSMSRSEGAVTLDLGAAGFAALTDADRSDFPVVFWHNRPDLPHTLVGRLHSDAAGTPPFNTSWEVMLLGRTAAELAEHRHLVENLNPPCAIADTSWIRPGRAICQVRNTRMVTNELQQLAGFASAHKLDYLEIDHSWCGAETKWTAAEVEFFDRHKSRFWDDKPDWRRNVGGNLLEPAKGWVPFRPKADSGGNFVDLDLRELARHAAGLDPPVGICVYVRGETLREFGGDHPVDDVFAAYQKWGLAGVKIGFVPSSSQRNERLIAELVRKAAGHRLVVCIHDAYLPSGLSRTWPNLVNVEGVAGEEAEHSIPPALKSRHDVMLPFTRGLMGPLDYTPEIYKKAKTHCHQVAMLCVYHGRTSIRGGLRQWSPGGDGGPEVEFVTRLPGLFDERRILATLGESVTVARRRGTTWFVASMGDGQPRSLDLPLDFLKPATIYQATLFTDSPGRQAATRLQQDVTAATVVPIRMEPDGGHLMILDRTDRVNRPPASSASVARPADCSL